MKVRSGFVSNSSSSSFIITNKTKEPKTLVDFVEENPHIVEDFIKRYHWHTEDEFNQAKMVKSAKNRNLILHIGKNEVEFGDEDGDVIGHVFDYMLRNSGKSKSFSWKLLKMNR